MPFNIALLDFYRIVSSSIFIFVVQSQCDDDISDAEKVYQECHQSGPLSFGDCIPPCRMKVCTKIGEGTFGEVFSTINDSNQTVALKVCTQYGNIYKTCQYIVQLYMCLFTNSTHFQLQIIPVEGSQKVNGEQQKTFGEILHEIIISK